MRVSGTWEKGMGRTLKCGWHECREPLLLVGEAPGGKWFTTQNMAPVTNTGGDAQPSGTVVPMPVFQTSIQVHRTRVVSAFARRCWMAGDHQVLREGLRYWQKTHLLRTPTTPPGYSQAAAQTYPASRAMAPRSHCGYRRSMHCPLATWPHMRKPTAAPTVTPARR